MASAERAAMLLTQLEPEDLRVLKALELGMSSFRYVPEEEVKRIASLNPKEFEYRIRRLNNFDLVYRRQEPYIGYILNYSGYDVLALNALVKADVLEALGKPLGIGKESDVYEALTPREERVAVKFHRLGRVSFRDTRRKRGYVGGRRHISWLYESRLAAEREFEALRVVYEAGVFVPRPIYRNRHVVVMGFIEGFPLVDVISLDDPEGLLEEILENIRLTLSVGIIHNDLSEFNIIVKPEGTVLIIDWPQYVTRDHPNAELFLKRDVENVLRYFRRKWGVLRNINETLRWLLA